MHRMYQNAMNPMLTGRDSHSHFQVFPETLQHAAGNQEPPIGVRYIYPQAKLRYTARAPLCPTHPHIIERDL